MLRVKSFLFLNTTTLILQAVEMGYWKKVSLWTFGKSHEMLSTLLLFSLSLCSMPTTGQLASQEVILFIKILWNQFGGGRRKIGVMLKSGSHFIHSTSLKHPVLENKQKKKKNTHKKDKKTIPQTTYQNVFEYSTDQKHF